MEAVSAIVILVYTARVLYTCHIYRLLETKQDFHRPEVEREPQPHGYLSVQKPVTSLTGIQAALPRTF